MKMIENDDVKIFKVEYINKNGAAIKYLAKAKSPEEIKDNLKGYKCDDLKITELSKEYYDDVDLNSWDNLWEDMLRLCEDANTKGNK